MGPGRTVNFAAPRAFGPIDAFVLPQLPEEAGLPRPNLSSGYIFAKEDKYFLYPNNYNHYNTYYRNTFQHGGISLEEMIIPVVTLTPKG